MAFTTYAAFASALAGMVVTGVKRRCTSVPAIINSADLPIQYPRLPEATGEIVSFAGISGIKQATIDLVIIIEATQQSTSPANFALAMSLMDNLDTALRNNVVAFGLDNWTMRIEPQALDDVTVYWLLVARITGSG